MIRMRATSSLAAVAITLVSVSLVQALYYVEGRHRWAVEPLVLVAAAVRSDDQDASTLPARRCCHHPRICLPRAGVVLRRGSPPLGGRAARACRRRCQIG